jgi:hypothetical protein
MGFALFLKTSSPNICIDANGLETKLSLFQFPSSLEVSPDSFQVDKFEVSVIRIYHFLWKRETRK